MPPIDPTTQDPGSWAFGFGLTVVLALAALVGLLLWFWTLYRVFRNPFLSDGQRIGWLLAVFFLPLVGMLLYALFRPRATIAGPMQQL